MILLAGIVNMKGFGTSWYYIGSEYERAAI
jgi:hypothetical protein